MNKSLIYMNLDDLISFEINNDIHIVACGLSNNTKQFVNKIKIDYILDNDISIQNTNYFDIPIISMNWLEQNISESMFIVIWGNHVEEFLLQMKLLPNANVVICTNKTQSLMKVNTEHYKDNLSNESKKKLFKDTITLIDIELTSYCNRKCWFCPNSYIDRKSIKEYMNYESYKLIIEDLKSIKYDNDISFNGYSEPTSNKQIFKYLQLARQNLPNALLHINTNGDYLSIELLDKLDFHGLNNLNIQLYLTKDEKFNLDTTHRYLANILKKVPLLDVEMITNNSKRIEFVSKYKNITIRIYSRNFLLSGVDRGYISVTADKYKRNLPCDAIFNQLIINHKCEVLPCCNIRTDIQEQVNSSYGTITLENTIFDVYSNKIAVKWRKNLSTYDNFFDEPCTYCQFSLPNKSELLKKHLTDL